VSLESLRRRMVVFLGAVIILASILISYITLAAPQWAEAATNSNTHQSVPATPQCMRRVTVASKPCGATIYIDGIEVGRTPMSFPMPLGRFTLVLFAPGHQPYGQRILVQDAPLEIDANLVPLP
jgi:hypothetical protein